MEILATAILIIFGLAGFAAIFFTTFGTLIILAGSVLYAFMTGFSIVSLKIILILSAFYLLGELLEYALVILGTKKFGATNAAVIGGLAGGILGAILGVMFFGIGIILGTFVGIFLGAFLLELLVKRDVIKSLKAGTGGVLGRIGAIAAKVIIAIIMFAILAFNIIRNS